MDEQTDLSFVDARLRDVEQRARGNSQKPATMQDVGELARHVRELVKIVGEMAPSKTA